MQVILTFKSIILLVLFSGAVFAQDISFNMEMTSPKSKEPVVMKVVSSGTKMAMIPNIPGEQGGMKIIIDNATNQQLILMDHGGQKMAMSVDQVDVDKYAEKAGTEPKITKTNETKTIDGFKCTKVVAETDEVISDLWLTEEAGLNYAELYKVFNSRSGTPGPDKALPALKGIKGFPIEIISKNKQKSEDVTIRIKNIDRSKVDPQFFSTDGYKVMDMRKSR